MQPITEPEKLTREQLLESFEAALTHAREKNSPALVFVVALHTSQELLREEAEDASPTLVVSNCHPLMGGSLALDAAGSLFTEAGMADVGLRTRVNESKGPPGFDYDYEPLGAQLIGFLRAGLGRAGRLLEALVKHPDDLFTYRIILDGRKR